jgi:glycosyltransferase involved in cell wall biosynthesis
VPNKGHAHLLRVLAAYRRLFRRPVRFLFVGELDGRVPRYHEELRQLAEEARVADAVVWSGRVGGAELKAYFLLAHAFLVMSEHEGFCVPIVEAMAHSVPVVAFGSNAVRETVGDGGIVLDSLDYDDYAAALEIMFSQAQQRTALLRRGRQRVVQRFAIDQLSRRLMQLLAPLLPPRATPTTAAAAP